MKKAFIGFSIAIAGISVLLIIFLATGLWKNFFHSEEEEITRTRIVTPNETAIQSVTELTGHFAMNERHNIKIPLEERELIIAVLNKESETGLAEEQFIVYRIANETGPAGQGPVNVTFLGFDPSIRGYRRMWDMPIMAVRPETITIFSQDLIGDRNNCIVVTGMNERNENTMTIFRRASGQPFQFTYNKIAEIQGTGSIIIQEINRSYAYNHGMARGASYNIVSYGHDPRSANMLDQIEVIYSYNAAIQRYEQTRVTRIPGSQIEQRQLRELLSGNRGVFERHIQGLWYLVSPQGTIDTRRYLFFDPAAREVIFYGDEAQQVFRWQVSTPTRLGLHIRSQNLSISTLLRFIELELASFDTLRIRVIEDVRLRIAVSNTWDGTYRRASAATLARQQSQIQGAVDALYDSSWGKLQFYNTGEYVITSSSAVRKGRYVFFNVDGNELLEMRPEDSDSASNRMLYRIENTAGLRILYPVRLGTTGIFDLQEPPVTLTMSNEQ